MYWARSLPYPFNGRGFSPFITWISFRTSMDVSFNSLEMALIRPSAMSFKCPLIIRLKSSSFSMPLI